MAIEIELKAWVEDRTAIRERLQMTGRHLGTYDKHDEYWRPSNLEADALGSGVRLRKTSSDPEAIVNFKRKEVRDGMEVNDEREFKVSDAVAFAELLSRIGLRPWIRKRKSGEAWDLDGITAELSSIEGLGMFIELEILAEDDRPDTVVEARRRLLEAIDRLGVDRSRIEPRYYTEMLMDAFESTTLTV